MLIANFIAFITILPYAISVDDHLVVHEHRDSIPHDFIFDGPASKSTSLDLRIALVSNNISGLEKVLYDVSTPDSNWYGKHLSKKEVESFVAPSSNTSAAVNNWLASHGLTALSISSAGDWLQLPINVDTADELFGANFSIFTHTATGQQSIRTLSYSIPASLQGHIDFIHPTVAFPIHSVKHPILTAPKILSRSVIASGAVPNEPCSELMTPTCLQSLYNIPTTPAPQSSNKLGVTGLNNHWAQQADLKLFLENFRTDINSSTTFTVQSVDGGTNPQGSGLANAEASLDTQYTVGLATGVPVTFISVGPQNVSTNQTIDFLDSFLGEAFFLLTQDAPPQVVTTSAGFTESNVPIPFANKLCTVYMQLGARGVSTIFASGDGGVSGAGQLSCTTFDATFPSTCPFVTSCGATTSVGPEIAANFSSGGFSAPGYFARPLYQAASVRKYLAALGTLNTGRFNPSGRAFPDVSAQGTNIPIVIGGQGGLINGTSCSSPIFASIIALINAELIAAGRRPLGFLNPFLYSKGANVFTDITAGSNPGCNTTGFHARLGWDPITGLGTPNYTALREAVGL